MDVGPSHSPSLTREFWGVGCLLFSLFEGELVLFGWVFFFSDLGVFFFFLAWVCESEEEFLKSPQI